MTRIFFDGFSPNLRSIWTLEFVFAFFFFSPLSSHRFMPNSLLPHRNSYFPFFSLLQSRSPLSLFSRTHRFSCNFALPSKSACCDLLLPIGLCPGTSQIRFGPRLPLLLALFFGPREEHTPPFDFPPFTFSFRSTPHPLIPLPPSAVPPYAV